MNHHCRELYTLWMTIAAVFMDLYRPMHPIPLMLQYLACCLSGKDGSLFSLFYGLLLLDTAGSILVFIIREMLSVVQFWEHSSAGDHISFSELLTEKQLQEKNPLKDDLY